MSCTLFYQTISIMSPSKKGTTFSLTAQAELQKLVPQHFGSLVKLRWSARKGRLFSSEATSHRNLEAQPKTCWMLFPAATVDGKITVILDHSFYRSQIQEITRNSWSLTTPSDAVVLDSNTLYCLVTDGTLSIIAGGTLKAVRCLNTRVWNTTGDIPDTIRHVSDYKTCPIFSLFCPVADSSLIHKCHVLSWILTDASYFTYKSLWLCCSYLCGSSKQMQWCYKSRSCMKMSGCRVCRGRTTHRTDVVLSCLWNQSAVCRC